MITGPAVLAPNDQPQNRGLTFLLVHPQRNDDLVAPNANQFLYTSDTSSGELREQNHAFNVVVFELHSVFNGSGPKFSPRSLAHKFHICAHLGDLAHLHHYQFIHFGISFSVVPHRSFSPQKVRGSRSICVYLRRLDSPD